MGWFVETESGFQLGPNLIMSFPNGKVPAKNEVDFVRANSKSFHALYIKFLSRVLQKVNGSNSEKEENESEEENKNDPDWAPTPHPKRKKGKGLS